jgi:hypothetical protein
MTSPPSARPASDQRPSAPPAAPPGNRARSIGQQIARELPLLTAALGRGVLLAVVATLLALSLAGSLDPTIALLVAASGLGQGAIVIGLAWHISTELRRTRRVSGRLTWTSAPSASSAAAPPPAGTAHGAASPELLATGEMNGRRYALFSDGSVELLTLLGRRRFRTIAHAREFVGG